MLDAILIAGTLSAVAPVACAPADKMRAGLLEKYAEAPAAGGLAKNGYLIQVFVGIDGNTWTIVSTSPAGLSCALSSGTNWRAKRPVVVGKDT